ncbi:MAG: ribosome assembly cofactor RimP [Bacteroidaceae bacterium]|nr:ribosome assembly cofactor RimP [Bacteroidaceae bacterium]
MIDKAKVQALVEQWLDGKDYFLTDLTVTPDDCITVEIDQAEGVWIEDCVQLSRFIEEHLSRDEEDYELEVGSAGLGQPFKVLRQWQNHVGKQVEVLTADGRKLKGELREADAEHIVLAVRQKVQVEGKKRPVMQDVDTPLAMSEVRSGRYLIDFK